MINFRYIVVILLAFLVISSCKNRVPKGFPKPNKMADIMTELHIIESVMQYGTEIQVSTKESHGYYKNVLEKYGYTYEQFDSIRKWYAHKPALYQKVYDRVIVNLSKRETELGLLLDIERKAEMLKASQDSILLVEIDKSELWQESDSIFIQPTDTIDKRIPFYINTDTLDLLGTLRLLAQYKFLNNDESKNPQMMLSAFYADSTADTLYIDIPHSFQQKTAMLDLLLDENKKATSINGFLLWQDSLLNPAVEISAISLKIICDTIKTEISPDTEKIIEIEKRIEIEKNTEKDKTSEEVIQRIRNRRINRYDK